VQQVRGVQGVMFEAEGTNAQAIRSRQGHGLATYVAREVLSNPVIEDYRVEIEA